MDYIRDPMQALHRFCICWQRKVETVGRVQAEERAEENEERLWSLLPPEIDLKGGIESKYEVLLKIKCVCQQSAV